MVRPGHGASISAGLSPRAAASRSTNSGSVTSGISISGWDSCRSLLTFRHSPITAITAFPDCHDLGQRGRLRKDPAGRRTAQSRASARRNSGRRLVDAGTPRPSAARATRTRSARTAAGSRLLRRPHLSAGRAARSRPARWSCPGAARTPTRRPSWNSAALGEGGRRPAAHRRRWKNRRTSRPWCIGQLAPDQVERLDAVGALVDLADARVARELLDARLGDVAVTAVHADRQACRLGAVVGAGSLDDRRQQRDQVVGRPVAGRGSGW